MLWASMYYRVKNNIIYEIAGLQGESPHFWVHAAAGDVTRKKCVGETVVWNPFFTLATLEVGSPTKG